MNNTEHYVIVKSKPSYTNEQLKDFVNLGYEEAFLTDVSMNKNHYRIDKYWRDSLVGTFENAYLTEDNFNEDLNFYIVHIFKSLETSKVTYELKNN